MMDGIISTRRLDHDEFFGYALKYEQDWLVFISTIKALDTSF